MYLFDDYPTRTVGYENQLMTAAMFPVGGKQVIHIIQKLSSPAEDIKLPRDEHPIRSARPKAPS